MTLDLAAAVACVLLGLLLAARAVVALRRSGGWILAELVRRARPGALRALGPPVVAPFSGRDALWTRARVLGPPPGGGPPRELWSRELHAEATVSHPSGEQIVLWDRALVVVPQMHRGGALKVLERDHPVLSRILARAGYAERPAGSTFFVLEEEVLLPSEPVHVHVSRDAEENPAMRGRMILSSLDPARRLLRLSWGPLLALWFSLLAIGAGVGVLLAALRLSSVR
jgi:hypothetical protein